MQATLTKRNEFSVIQNCGSAFVCHDASGIVSGIYPLCAEQPGGIYRGNREVSVDLDWIYRCSLCVQYKTAYGIGTCKRQVVSKSKESTDDSDGCIDSCICIVCYYYWRN